MQKLKFPIVIYSHVSGSSIVGRGGGIVRTGVAGPSLQNFWFRFESQNRQLLYIQLTPVTSEKF